MADFPHTIISLTESSMAIKRSGGRIQKSSLDGGGDAPLCCGHKVPVGHDERPRPNPQAPQAVSSYEPTNPLPCWIRAHSQAVGQCPAAKAVAVPGSWRLSAASLAGRREGTRSTTYYRFDSCDGDAGSDEESADDSTFEKRHAEFQALERKGFDVVHVMRKRRDESIHGVRSPRVSGGGCCSSYEMPRTPGKQSPTPGFLAPSDECDLRRAAILMMGKPPTHCCAACPPYFKHTAHTCGKVVTATASKAASYGRFGAPAARAAEWQQRRRLPSAPRLARVPTVGRPIHASLSRT